MLEKGVLTLMTERTIVFLLATPSRPTTPLLMCSLMNYDDSDGCDEYNKLVACRCLFGVAGSIPCLLSTLSVILLARPCNETWREDREGVQEGGIVSQRIFDMCLVSAFGREFFLSRRTPLGKTSSPFAVWDNLIRAV